MKRSPFSILCTTSLLLLSIGIDGCGSEDVHPFGGGVPASGNSTPASDGGLPVTGSGGIGNLTILGGTAGGSGGQGDAGSGEQGGMGSGNDQASRLQASGGVTGSGGAASNPTDGPGNESEPGSAAAASGGTAAGGRASANGGSPTGGNTATGGSIGAGGVPAAERSATGGSGAGGLPGTGGALGTTAACQQYSNDYDAELNNARMCKGNKAKACAMAVPSKLAGCGSACTTFVDKTAMLEQIQKKWIEAGCVSPTCVVFVCVNPVSSSCSESTGLCIETLLGG